jgi:hypothetical protein
MEKTYVFHTPKVQSCVVVQKNVNFRGFFVYVDFLLNFIALEFQFVNLNEWHL